LDVASHSPFDDPFKLCRFIASSVVADNVSGQLHELIYGVIIHVFARPGIPSKSFVVHGGRSPIPTNKVDLPSASVPSTLLRQQGIYRGNVLSCPLIQFTLAQRTVFERTGIAEQTLFDFNGN
jgi:hypothetical protein